MAKGRGGGSGKRSLRREGGGGGGGRGREEGGREEGRRKEGGRKEEEREDVTVAGLCRFNTPQTGTSDGVRGAIPFSPNVPRVLTSENHSLCDR